MSQSNAHDHGHDHDHDHTPTVTSANERKVLVSFFLIFGFMLVEAVGGVLSGSLALLADAGHMLTDAVALALAYAAFRFGRRAADSKRTFGYLRFEVIAGFLNAVTLFAIVAWIAYEAWERLQAPPVILAGPMMIEISLVYRRVIRSISPTLISAGSHTTPPFAPPYGSPITAHFHVISIASALTSSSVTPGW